MDFLDIVKPNANTWHYEHDAHAIVIMHDVAQFQKIVLESACGL
jgi:hypothetical protein